MNIKITPRFCMKVEMDGIPLDGEFVVESMWNGLVCLSSNGPCRKVIIEMPKISHLNVYDSLPQVMGGNATTDKDIKPFEAEVVSRDFETPAEAHERHRKQKSA